MERDRFNLPLWIGLLVSLALHALLIIPAVMQTMTASGEMVSVAATFNPEDINRHEPDRERIPPELTLGIDNGSPSTVTWLGYKEYEEQKAPLSEVEQAAFTDDPTAATAPPTEMPPTDAPRDEPAPTQEQAAPQPQQNDSQSDAAKNAQPSPTEADQKQSNEKVAMDAAATEHPSEAPAELSNVDDAPAQPIATTPNVSPTAVMFAFAEQLRELIELASSSAAEAKAADAAAASSQAAAPATGATAASSAAAPADPSAERADMDSDPSSTVEVPIEQIRLGKPLAARGLTLRPQKPTFTTLTLMTAAPRNPLVEIDFGSDGRPLDARVVQSSRDPRVDAAIEASLYRWRAEGKPLELLKDLQIITVQMRIILNSRVREE